MGGYMVAAIARGRPLRTGLEFASYLAGVTGHCFGGDSSNTVKLSCLAF